MFRMVYNQFLKGKCTTFIPAKKISQAQVNVLPKRPKEKNVVVLMGTIDHKVQRLSNGSIRLYLKTLNEDTSYCIHRVGIANKHLLNMVGNQLSVNQRIYIGGRLKTDNMLIENQLHQDVEVLANELYFLEPNPSVSETEIQKPMQMDQNYVEFLAFIGSEVINEQRFSAFSLVTHFIKMKGTKDESEGRECHRVMIYNQPKLMQTAHHLKKFDRVYVTGFLNYITKTYPDGSDYSNGFIQPTNIIKLKKFYKH